jgi:hypothetical protein
VVVGVVVGVRRGAGLAALAWSVALCACGGDDLTYEPGDAGADASLAVDGGGRRDASDAAPAPADAGEDGEVEAGRARRLLLSYNASSNSELAVFGVDSKKVEGSLVYPGALGAPYVGSTDPWLLEQADDLVARLDGDRPWTIRSSWNVALSDARDGGEPYADPDAVIVGAASKAYVLRYTRNAVAVIDTSQPVDGGTPVKTIDLGGLVQPGGDGVVEMTAGVYVPSKKLVYVLLGNFDRGNAGCADTHPTVVAIDVTTDTLVPLGPPQGDASTGAGFVLSGYRPVFGPGAIAYDVQNDRLLVLHAGCAVAASDGGAGSIARRQIEAVSLSSGAAQVLLDLTAAASPQQLVFVDAHHAIVQLEKAYAWDPAAASLGPPIPNAPDAFVYDGVGNLLGIASRPDADGGVAGFDVVSVRAADGQLTKLGADPFSLVDGSAGAVALWPPY